MNTNEAERQNQYMHRVYEINSIPSAKRYHISTFGCQLNENDSEKLEGMLVQMGYSKTENLEESNFIIYNTCCVRENAEQKVYGHLGRLKKLKEKNPELLIAMCGCMMQQKHVIEHIKRTYRHVDIIFGTHNLHKLPELLYTLLYNGEKVIDVWETDGVLTEGIPFERKKGVKAWLTVMYGCNNFCSYCIVPYVRGRERSRELDDILNEANKLSSQGFKEITLLGQNVNSYGKELEKKLSFAELLYRLNGIDGIERIRFMTSHPKDLSDELIDAIRLSAKVCEHLHLPVQAGSTKILKEMNRKYSKENYLELIDKVKNKIPGIALTTDIIVGFPGETEKDFEVTLDVMEKVRYDSAYTFLYSKRTGTPAALKQDQVPEIIKKERFNRLIQLQNTISKEINDTYVGQKVDVLVEGISKTNKDMLTGRTGTNKIVNFSGPAKLIYKTIKVHITNSQTWSLDGEFIS